MRGNLERELMRARVGSQLNQAVREGLVIKPERCSKCGKKPFSKNLHGHHADYSKPLEVVWLCHYCHMEVHGTLRWFDRCFRWLQFCEEKGMDPAMAKLPAVNPRTGKQTTATWMDLWRKGKL